jgi:hypothetical protein
MNEYTPLIMAAAFVIALSVAVKLLTGKSVHKEEKKQQDFAFPPIQPKAAEQPEREMTAGARR